MLNAEPKQFRLNDEGLILYQADATNPLPGLPVARVRKGEALLLPDIEILDGAIPDGQDREAVVARLREWLAGHVASVLEPLKALEAAEGEGVDDSVRGISLKLHESLGTMERAQAETLIAALTPEGRGALRKRRVRLGPVLIFIPDLNKPAAVRLRALLWTLWHGADLPARVPPDGMTSLRVEDPDKAFYRAIGYPVYGHRAIRVDMLDRLIGAIYDSAKDGMFQAKHQMAEWLGCPVSDLYEVLEAMGHVRVAEAAAPAEVPPEPPIEPPAPVEGAPDPEPAASDPAAAPGQAAAEGESAEPPARAAPARPELATFRLRKGRAYDTARPPRPDRKPRPAAQGKPFAAKHGRPDGEKREDRKPRPFPKKDGKKHRDREEPRRDRVISAAAPEPKPEDSPFAILKRLKAGGPD